MYQREKSNQDSQEEKWLKNSVRQMKNVNWIAKSSDIV